MEAESYELTTERLRLRALSLVEVRLAVAGDRAALGERIGANVPAEWPGANLAANLPSIAADMARLPGDERWVWAVIERAASAVIGDVGFHSPVSGRPAVEMGYVLLPAFHGRGYATEASTALLAWAFGRPSVERVILHIAPDNAASLRVAQKLGMRETAPDAPGYRRFERGKPERGEQAQ